ncbi:MAG: hypothetical protein WCQ47_08700 [bacterium]
MNILIIFNLLLNFTVADPLESPRTCKDLLPDMNEYISFMEEVGSLWVAKDPTQARKVYDALAIRKLYQDTTKDSINPIDNKIKDFLCGCSDQPYKADSSKIRSYSKNNISKLISSASDDYLKLKMEIYQAEKIDRMTSVMKNKIDRIKMDSMYKMNKALSNAFNKKLKKTKKS